MRWLSWILWAPLAGTLLLVVIPRSRGAAARWWGFVVSLVTFAFSLGLVASFRTGEAAMQFVEKERWIRAFGADYHLGVDGISLWLIVLTAFLFPVSILASWRVERDPRLFIGLLLALETTILGVFMAQDLLLFILFWDAMLVPMYFLIGYWGYENRVYAAVKFFLYTLVGGLLMFAGILVLAFTASGQVGEITFDLQRLQTVTLSSGTERWLFLAFFAAFAIKVPLFPLHTWLPDAHTEAPTAGSVILAGVLLKMGAYGFLRFSSTLFPHASQDFAPWIVGLAIVGILYGAIVSTMQRDLKRLVAYSSVAHLGFVVLGIFAFTLTSLQGASIQMINHGLSTGALFLLVGMLYERRHTRMIDDFGGLASAAPVFSGLFLVVALSSLGLPGLNGFVGEFLILVGAFARNEVWAILGALGIVLAALYLLWAYQRVMHGPITRDENRTMADLNRREVALLAPVIALIVMLGVFPKPFLDKMEPSLQRVVERVQQANPDQPAHAQEGR